MNIVKLTGTLEDGSTVELFPVQTTMAPTISEVDVVESDGTTEKFAPEA